MTKGDRDRIRAEIAATAACGWLSNTEMLEMFHENRELPMDFLGVLAEASVQVADKLMDRLGLSEASEQAEIQREAERRRGSVP